MGKDTQDFYFKNGSLAIETGLDLGYDKDFEDHKIPYGIKPDIGAFEFGYQ